MAETTANTAPPIVGEQSVPTQRAPESHVAQLVPIRGPETGNGVALTGTLTTICRDRHCDLVLDDTTVSLHHADLRQHTPQHYCLTDVGSLNGLYLNRQPVQRADLADGDEIWIGKARFAFRLPVS